MKKYILPLVVFCFYNLNVVATTIRPFKNLKKLVDVSELVIIGKCISEYYIDDGGIKKFRYAIESRDLIKGELPTKYIDLYTYRLEGANFYREVADDIELEVGRHYLLFLENLSQELYRPIAFSYYLYKEESYQNRRILMPVGIAKQFNISHSGDYEPLVPIESEKFVKHVQDVLMHGKEYDIQNIKAGDFPESLESRDFPTHCLNLFGNTDPVRWKAFDDGIPLTIYADSEADLSRSNSHALLSSAISQLNSGYNGINLTYGGTQNYNPNCGANGNDPTGSNLTGFLSGLPTGLSNALVIFNDPCNEEPPYCASEGGTLGYGGTYGYSPKHSWDGIDWWMGRYGYVVIVDDICYPSPSDPWGLNDSEYIIMLKHELTHTLGLSHISPGVGAALMNPSCCNDIANLDVECLDHMYLASSLPVELISFDGENQESMNYLSWITQNEINHDFYLLERSSDGESFVALGQVTSPSIFDGSNHYQFIDTKPIIGQNYYRLRQTDLDGAFTYSDVIAIEYYPASKFHVFPNPTFSGKFQILFPHRDPRTSALNIYNLLGKKMENYQILGNQGPLVHIDLGTVGKGIYIITYEDRHGKWSKKLMVE